jgi:hypothetical protein
MLKDNDKLRKFLRITIITVVVLLLCYIGIVVAAVPTDESNENYAEATVVSTEMAEPVKVLKEYPMTFSEDEYVEFFTVQQCEDYKAELNVLVIALEGAITSDEYSTTAVDSMIEEQNRIIGIIEKLEADIAKYNLWEQEHFYATRTYLFLRQNGYSSEVACAIIGNMMIETSGGSLNLKPFVYDASGWFYGLCQWSLYYYPKTRDLGFEDQLAYLIGNIETEFNTFGSCYRRGFTYEKFIEMTDPYEAAIAFAKVYERCASGTYNMRANCAVIAYNYFVGETAE